MQLPGSPTTLRKRLQGAASARTAYPDQSAGLPLLGDADFIQVARRDDFTAFLDTHYRTRNMAVVGAGDIDHDAFCDAVVEQFSALPLGDGTLPERHTGSAATRPLRVPALSRSTSFWACHRCHGATRPSLRTA